MAEAGLGSPECGSIPSFTDGGCAITHFACRVISLREAAVQRCATRHIAMSGREPRWQGRRGGGTRRWIIMCRATVAMPSPALCSSCLRGRKLRDVTFRRSISAGVILRQVQMWICRLSAPPAHPPSPPRRGRWAWLARATSSAEPWKVMAATASWIRSTRGRRDVRTPRIGRSWRRRSPSPARRARPWHGRPLAEKNLPTRTSCPAATASSSV